MVRIASQDPAQARKDKALRGLLDNYERAVIDRFEAQGISDSWDVEVEVDNRWLRLRKRVFKACAAGDVEGITLTPEAITAMCDEARRDEINRAADWLLSQAARCFDRGSSHDHHEAQVLTRYSSLLRDMPPFPYRPRESSVTFASHTGKD